MTPHTFRLAIIKLLFASLVFVSSTLQALDVNAIWLGTVGNWTDASKWSTKPNFPNNNGAQLYYAVIDSGNVTLNKPITIEELMVGVAGVPTLQGNNILNVRSNFGLNQGLITGNATLNALVTATISGNSNLNGWHLTLSGHTMWSGRLGVGNASVIDNLSGATLDLSAGAICTYYDMGNPHGRERTLNNYGTINANSGDGITLDVTLNNLATINVNSGPLVLAGGGVNNGTINLANGTTLDFEDTNLPTGTNYVFTPASSISGIGSVKFNSQSSFAIHGVYNITGTTTVGGTVNFISPFINLGSSLVISGQFANCDLGSNSVTVSNLNLRSGAIRGSGIVTVNGPLEWNEGSMLGGSTTIAQDGVFFNGLTGLYGFNILDRTLNCYGSSSVQTTANNPAYLNFDLNAVLNIMPGASFNGSHLMILGSSIFGQTNGIVTNYGTLVVDSPGVTDGMGVFGTAFVNQGSIQLTNGTLDVRSTTNQPAFVQNAGSVQLNNGTLHCDSSRINGGSLSGYGTVGNIVSNGLITPSGSLSCLGTLNLQSNSVLAYTLSGRQPGVSFGYIVNVSTATLGGALQVRLSEGFRSQITSSDIFTVLFAQSITGQFTNVVSGARLPTADGSGSFVVTYSGNQVVLSDFLRNGSQ